MNLGHKRKILSKFLLLILLQITIVKCAVKQSDSKIDRYALVTRNNIVVESADTLSALSVGNGNFAFTTDITGLQTFYKEYENGLTLGTQSNWGWHTFPNKNSYSLDECIKYFDFNGSEVPYLHQFSGNDRDAQASNYFRENPHRLQLGIIRLILLKENGTEAKITDIISPVHSLDLWSGKISTSFVFDGEKVNVEVYAHQLIDQISARIESTLIKKNRLKIEFIFPFAVPKNTHSGYNFDQENAHETNLELVSESEARIERKLDNDKYFVRLNWQNAAEITQTAKHKLVLSPSKTNVFEFSSHFTPNNINEAIISFTETKTNSTDSWKYFWEKSGVVDFSECTDPRAIELERRFVLSQYLTKIQNSGNLPPQETGLVYNSWYGKFHLEMHWWHSAHFANWNHPEFIDKQLEWYKTIYNKSTDYASGQGFKGVRWPKMVGPEGQTSPSTVGNYLIWQQPHFIYMAEQLYKQNTDSTIISKYRDLVFATAEFMADFAVYDSKTDVYNLLPPLIPAQEHWSRETTMNPPYELAYWYWGLTVAQEWRKRLGMAPEPKWEDVRLKLATPVQQNGVYLGIANAPDSYTNHENMTDHPAVTGALGLLPQWDKVDPEIMRNTLKVVMQKWDWPSTWGWDYPMVAMCATRLNEPEIALEALLKDVQKNTYLINGHNYQSERLRIYLPGNGGFIKAIALMTAGWEGSSVKNPGFPKNGTWNVKWEGISKDF